MTTLTSLSTVALLLLAQVSTGYCGVLKARVPTCPVTSVQNSVTSDADFDDLISSTSTVALETIQEGYVDLLFKSFALVSTVETGFLPGPLPHSPPNMAGTAVQDVLSEGKPMITIDFEGSTTIGFDFKSFYYACTLDLPEGAIGVNEKCTVNITGYANGSSSNTGGVQVCHHSYPYSADLLAVAQMASSGPIDDCLGLSYLTFSTAGTNGLVGQLLHVLSALLIDDVEVKTYSCE